MAISESLETCFRPEERKRGEDLYAKGVVNLSSTTDCDVRALVKASGAPRVSLASSDVASATFDARCSCTTGAKGVLCKHVWATLLALDEREADFLSDKHEAQAIGRADPNKAKREERNAQARERAKEMRRAKKSAEKPTVSHAIHPEPVDEALSYFRENGFDLAADLEMEAVLDAKRLLARVFHPDKGGTHDEAIELNHNFEVLREYLNG